MERGKRKSEGDQPGQRKKRRFRPGTVVLQEICKFQKTTSFLIRMLPFVRKVREIAQQLWGSLRCQVIALVTLQEAMEA